MRYARWCGRQRSNTTFQNRFKVGKNQIDVLHSLWPRSSWRRSRTHLSEGFEILGWRIGIVFLKSEHSSKSRHKDKVLKLMYNYIYNFFFRWCLNWEFRCYWSWLYEIIMSAIKSLYVSCFFLNNWCLQYVRATLVELYFLGNIFKQDILMRIIWPQL